MKKGRLSSDEKLKIQDLNLVGESIEEICNILNRSYDTVEKYIKEFGLKLDDLYGSKKEKPKKKKLNRDEELKKAKLKLFEQGLTKQQVESRLEYVKSLDKPPKSAEDIYALSILHNPFTEKVVSKTEGGKSGRVTAMTKEGSESMDENKHKYGKNSRLTKHCVFETKK